MKAAEFSQNLIKKRPLLECGIPYKNEFALWEFNICASFLSTSKGLFKEPKLKGLEERVEIIFQKTKYNKRIVISILKKYKFLHSN